MLKNVYLRRQLSLLMIGLYLLTGLASIAQQKPIPKPEETLGFPVGADYKLATYEQALSYFKKLDEASDMLKLVYVGETSEGRPWYFALISSPQNLANIDKYRSIAQRLAHPAGLTDEEAKKLSLEGKPLVHIDGGLHASEVAGAQHTISLAYDMLSKASEPKTKAILDNVILLLWPSLNPDGQTMIGDWYKSNVGTPYEIAPPPFLYQKYVGHDNNRDAYMLNMIESRVVARTWREWEPNIIFVHHQTSPFPTRIWLPPFAEPVAPQTPPIIAREVNMIGMAMAQALESNGQKGATHMGTGFDAWYPGYIDYMPVMQNIPSFWTETALYNYATPHFYTIRDFPQDKKELRVESLYSSPWPGGWWRISDAMAYMETASLATLDYAAKYSDVLLYNRYQAGRNTIQKYEQEPPYAYFIPQKQRDSVRPVELLRRLAFHGIRIGQLTKEIQHNGHTYPKGTWVIPMNQEYAELTRQLLDVQVYPDLREFPGGPPEQPYDAAGWTLPLQFELNVQPAMTPLTADQKAAIQLVSGTAKDWQKDDKKDATPADFVAGIGFDTNPVSAGINAPEGRLTGSGTTALVSPIQNNSFKLIGRALKSGGTVKFQSDSQRYAVSGVNTTTLEQWVKDLGITAERTANASGATVKPRIALYKPWTASMDAGWTEWVLEQFDLPFATITNTDMQENDLSDRFDVIVMASDRPQTIKNGFAKGAVPPAYEGGLGELGSASLTKFVSQGGTLVCLNASCDYAIEALHLPVKNVVAGVARKDFFTGGSLLEVETDPTHPVMAGMPGKAAVFVDGSPVFATLDGFKGQALAKFASTGSPLRSGYLLGEKYLQGYAASLDVQQGRGHVVLIGFRPQWRGQPLGTYRVLLNSVLYGGDVAKGKYGTPDFWKSPSQKPKDEDKK
ncbi:MULTISPECIES: M14 metallopeptidase family protein [unclassified Spirosoma]|uniref:M14 family metallopeptidase n=1 Tax=unclassified Spirosoma TaxID=2621999 RepID=UPI000AC62320|nr:MULTISPECIES: M14 metallopeptidase family protein [unclassified Spirosoma]